MGGNVMAISDYKEQIREIVVSGKEYLADNDLSGFYDHVMTKGSDAEIISGVWDFMEKCGIFFPIDVGSENEAIPPFYNAYRQPSGFFLNGKTLRFPHGITVLQSNSFENSFGYDKIDLTGIKFVLGSVFSGVKGVKEVIITNDLSLCKTSAFQGMGVDVVFKVPEDADDFIKRCFANKTVEYYG